MRPEEAGRLVLGTGPLWTRGPRRSISASAVPGRHRAEREGRVAATAECSRVGAGCRLRARRETVRGGPHGQVEDEVEDEVAGVGRGRDQGYGSPGLSWGIAQLFESKESTRRLNTC